MSLAYTVLGLALLAGGLFDAYLGLTGYWGQWWAIGLCGVLLFAGGTVLYVAVSILLGRVTPKKGTAILGNLFGGIWF
jgi:hypothetical protein